eukprot:TRINITY_DN77971_c0_g1_i1.p1 TRINITY_DN77971_c0_g1~~TRINITY_DN77971_c0_g1_i1.p1  ORF type:complete len:142 (-),score=27.42 TRINITY_DN77971_c0_g1_i1:180-605(-)
MLGLCKPAAVMRGKALSCFAARRCTASVPAGAACHEAVRLWVERAIPAHRTGELSTRPAVMSAYATTQWPASQDLRFVKHALGAFAVMFPLISIPVIEMQMSRIRELEAEVAEQERKICHLKKEVEVSQTTNNAAVCGIIF